MNRLANRMKSGARMLALIGFFGLFVLAVMTSLDISMRWLFARPIQGVNDISSVVMAVVIASCIPANLAMKQNIRVDVLGALGGRRFNLLLELFASVLTLVFIAIIAWQFIPYVIGLYETGNRTWVLAWPVWPWWSFAVLMLCLAVVTQVIATLADLIALLTLRTQESDAQH